MNAVVVDYAPLPLSGSLRSVLEVHNGYHYHRCKRAYGDTNRVMWAPRLDVRELDHAFLVEADLRGMALADITVSLENNTLVIAGERKATWIGDDGRPTHRKLSYGAFQRVLTLPTAVNADQFSWPAS